MGHFSFLLSRSTLLTAGAILVILLLGYIPAWTYVTRRAVPDPDAILVLGGAWDRMEYAARLAKQNPALPIWISGYRRRRLRNEAYFKRHKIAPQRLHYDICATDTVTNFTCTINDLQTHGIRHIYLVTSDYHMIRAKAIAYWILGSRGMVFTPYETPCKCSIEESRGRILRDQVRSLLWIGTGRTGLA